MLAQTRHLIIATLCFITITSTSNSYSENTIVLANGEWEPYFGKSLKEGGAGTHIVTAAFKEVGVNVKYLWYGQAWKRAFIDAAKGRKAIGSAGWAKKSEREDLVYYSKNIVIPSNQDVFWYLKETNFDWSTLDDLSGLVVGGTLGLDYGIEIEKAIKNKVFEMDLISKEFSNFNKLLNKRIDLFASVKKVGEAWLKKNLSLEDRAKITYHKKPWRVIDYHLILSKAHPENELLMKKFDEGIRIIKASGLYQKIMDDMDLGSYNLNKE